MMPLAEYSLFDKGLESILIYSAAVLVIWALVSCTRHTLAALKDPDVQAASRMGMTIMAYRKFRKLHSRLMEFRAAHPGDEAAVQRFFLSEIYPGIKGREGKWQAFCQYQLQLTQEDQREEIRRLSGRD